MASAAPSRMVDREEFTVQGMTGVDLSLQIAGPGSRSYAFIIDWHIRLVVAITWLCLGMLVTSGSLTLPPKAGAWTVTAVVGPPIVIYLFYHLIIELLMHGQTPGKRMAGVRIVNRDGGPPGAGAILVRNAFRLIDSMPMLYAIGLICTFVTRQRLRIGDMAAGTLLVMKDAGAGNTIDQLAARRSPAGLDLATLDLVEQLLERWNELGKGKRRDIARSLLLRIDANPPRPPAAMNDVELRARLQALSDSGESRP